MAAVIGLLDQLSKNGRCDDAEAISLWEVVGGKDGGILVRQGKDLQSPATPGGRLSTGALIAQLDIDGNRLRYSLIAGSGPKDGWVSIELKDKPIVKRFEEKGATLDAEGDVEENTSNKDVVWVVAQGSRGDVQPMVALSLALKKRGFYPRILGTSGFPLEFAKNHGIASTEYFTNVSNPVDVENIGVSEDGLNTHHGRPRARDWIRFLQEEQAKAEGKEVEAPPEEPKKEETQIEHIQRRVAEVKEKFKAEGKDINLIRMMDCMGDESDDEETKKKKEVENDNAKADGSFDIGHVEGGEVCCKIASFQLQELLKKESPVLVYYGNMCTAPIYHIWKKCRARMVKFDFYPDCEWWSDPEGMKKSFEDPYGQWQVLAKWTEELVGTNPFEGVTGDDWVAWGKENTRVLCDPSVIAHFPKMLEKDVEKWKTDTCVGGCIILDLPIQVTDKKFFGGADNFKKMQDFIDGCETPPFHCGWGSMPVSESVWWKFMIILKYKKWKAVMVQGWSSCDLEGVFDFVKQYDPSDASGIIPWARENVVWVKVCPQEWVFPRMCCNIHHGGNGTTMTALRSGIPTIINPVGWWDQVTYAQWVKENKWGSYFSHYLDAAKMLDPKWMKPMTMCISDKEVIDASRANGERLRKLDIVGDLADNAVKLVEEHKRLCAEPTNGKIPFGR